MKSVTRYKNMWITLVQLNASAQLEISVHFGLMTRYFKMITGSNIMVMMSHSIATTAAPQNRKPKESLAAALIAAAL